MSNKSLDRSGDSPLRNLILRRGLNVFAPPGQLNRSMPRILPIVRRLFRSRVGWVLAITEIAVIVFWFRGGTVMSSVENLAADDVWTGRFIGGRFVELHSTLSCVLVVINVIPVFTAQLLSKVVSFVIPTLSVPALSWVHAFELLLLTTVQWLIVGYFIEQMIALVRNRD